ncbi:MAG: bifunctional glutamate--cysteine ligase GshA/glutathione synthetase GshB [Lentisphaeria bacterium]|nr:bifunctional glutamate--cysteine ligase GshA/glutathione synthetase GshB [Lentisphaeria bacterium]
MDKWINYINDQKLNLFLTKANFGLEKENVRVDLEGHLSSKPHPASFGDKLNNPYITTDFSESQVEVITPSVDTLEEAHDFLKALHNIVALELEDEYLWPLSSPPSLPPEDEIKASSFGDSESGQKANAYRDYLTEKYGKTRQLLSGIHYNFSFKETFLQELFKISELDDYTLFKDSVYLKLSRNFFKHRWILIYLFGASPGVHESFTPCCLDELDEVADKSFSYCCGNSFRNGPCGYKNMDVFNVSYDTRADYVKGIRSLMADGTLINEKEYYSPIRLKAKDNVNLLDSIEKDGIEYVEIRLLDLNPLDETGLSLEQLQFVHLFVLYCLFDLTNTITPQEMVDGDKNHERIAQLGRKHNVTLATANGEKLLKDQGLEIITDIRTVISKLHIDKPEFIAVLDDAEACFEDKTKLISRQVDRGIRQDGFIQYNLDLAKQYLGASQLNRFSLVGFEDLELSTQILLKEAIKRGLKFEILDRNENFISLSDGTKTEYVIQATKTSLDSYSTVLLMENKLVTKKILTKAGIKVPTGGDYTNKVDALADSYRYSGKKIVVKPNSTNFGLGITILQANHSAREFSQAIDFAFSEDKSILIEAFIEGKEYRIFVLGDKVVGILHRVPANVVGDGQSTITQLVTEKNRDFLRGTGYKKPLQVINLGEAEATFLAVQNLDFNSIPKLDETVYLRENSNISTGGDSIDFTDDILEEYKQIAIQSAKAADATICGVDMMIRDITEKPNPDNHGIIEINFNPAIHIHCYPYKGKNRKLGEKMLTALGF